MNAWVFLPNCCVFICKSWSKSKCLLLRQTKSGINISEEMRILSRSDQLPACESHVLPTVLLQAADPAASSPGRRNSTQHDHETLRETLWKKKGPLFRQIHLSPNQWWVSTHSPQITIVQPHSCGKDPLWCQESHYYSSLWSFGSLFFKRVGFILYNRSFRI